VQVRGLGWRQGVQLVAMAEEESSGQAGHTPKAEPPELRVN
jgi:hypothetical protein